MEPSEDKQWAAKYLLDPLNAPEPSQETGPGTHFSSVLKNTAPAARSSSGNSGMNQGTSSRGHSRTSSSNKSPNASSYPTPPGSASPSRASFSPTNPYSTSHRQSAFAGYTEDGPSRQKSVDKKNGNETVNEVQGRRRGSSLGQRYPGDSSNRPLDIIRRETKAANRSPHLNKKHIPGADLIDNLDDAFGGAYHHEGPYDATLLARNTNYKSSPVEAVRNSNAEALRATPKDLIRDSLDKHVPLQGTAVIPPGERDLHGNRMQYEEGADLMREPDAAGGAYKRLDGVKYLPGDLKGKGEPSYSLEKALKEHKISSHRRVMSDGDSGYEMQPGVGRRNISEGNASGSASGHQRSSSGTGIGNTPQVSNSMRQADIDGNLRRTPSTGLKVGEGLKKRFGSLRRGKKTTDA